MDNGREGSIEQPGSVLTRGRDLLIAPTRFFSTLRHPVKRKFVWGAALILGIALAYGRIEQSVLRAEAGINRDWDVYGSPIMRSWLVFWSELAIVSVVWAAFVWYVGAWWYRVRVRWSGASAPEWPRVRAVYFFASLVHAVPSVLMLLYYTVRFPNFAAAWADPAPWSTLYLIFPFWSAFSSYRGVQATFDVRRVPARVWFLIAPTIAFIFVFGVFGLVGAMSTTGR